MSATGLHQEAQPTVRREDVQGIAVLTLDRSEHANAINMQLIRDLHSALADALASRDVGVIVLTGAGDRAFCAGDDLNEAPTLGPEAIRRHVELIQDITRLIIFSEKPVIAGVNGWAVGGGLEWVLNCDLAIWADTARGFMPEVSLGLGVSGAVTWLLPQMVGGQRARALLLLGEQFTAQELADLGLAHSIVPQARLEEEVLAIAHRLAALPEAAVAGLKRSLTAVQRTQIEQALDAEADNLVRLLSEPATRARIAEAWKERTR